MKFPILSPNLVSLKHSLTNSVYFAFRANQKVTLGDVHGRGRIQLDGGDILYATISGRVHDDNLQVDIPAAIGGGHIRCLMPGIRRFLIGKVFVLKHRPGLDPFKVIDKDKQDAAQAARMKKSSKTIRLSDVANPSRRPSKPSSPDERKAFEQEVNDWFSVDG